MLIGSSHMALDSMQERMERKRHPRSWANENFIRNSFSLKTPPSPCLVLSFVFGDENSFGPEQR